MSIGVSAIAIYWPPRSAARSTNSTGGSPKTLICSIPSLFISYRSLALSCYAPRIDHGPDRRGWIDHKAALVGGVADQGVAPGSAAAHGSPPLRRHPYIFQIMAEELAPIEVEELQLVATAPFEDDGVALLVHFRPKLIPIVDAHADVVELQRIVERQGIAIDVDQARHRLDQLILEIVDPYEGKLRHRGPAAGRSADLDRAFIGHDV